METEISKSKLLKRFKILSMITLAVLILHFLLLNFTNNFAPFDKYSMFFFFGLGSWFFLDNEMLSVDSIYLKSLLLGIGILAYGYFLRHYYPDRISQVTGGSSLSTLTLLLIQWPTRRVYKALFKREPEIADDFGTFVDLIYTMILFFGWIILPIIITDFLNE